MRYKELIMLMIFPTILIKQHDKYEGKIKAVHVV